MAAWQTPFPPFGQKQSPLQSSFTLLYSTSTPACFTGRPETPRLGSRNAIGCIPSYTQFPAPSADDIGLTSGVRMKQFEDTASPSAQPKPLTALILWQCHRTPCPACGHRTKPPVKAWRFKSWTAAAHWSVFSTGRKGYRLERREHQSSALLYEQQPFPGILSCAMKNGHAFNSD